MSPFVIFAIVLTVAYIFYFGIVIAHDLYGKKGQENSNEEHFDVSSMQGTEESTQVDEDGDGFRRGGESSTESSMDSSIKYPEEKHTLSDDTPDNGIKESIAEKQISALREQMEETASFSSYAVTESELHKLLLSGEVSHTNGIGIP